MAFVITLRSESATSLQLEEALEALIVVGADQVELDDGAVLGLFHGAESGGARWVVQEELRRRGLDVEIGVEPAELVDWNSVWAPSLRALSAGPLMIRPSRGAPAAGVARGPGELCLEVGSAFGTGGHATTRLCLDQLVAHPPRGLLLDVGTGTGILALAGLALGAARAVGTDTDPEALRVAGRNARVNGLEERFLAVERPPRGLRADRIVANLLAAPLMELAPELAGLVASRGEVSLSGFPAGQVDQVVAVFGNRGLRCVAREVRDGWARVDLVPAW